MAISKPLGHLVRLTAIALLGSFCLLAAPTADEVIKHLQDRYNGARTLALQFTEEYSMQGHPRPAESGTLTLRKVGKMRWDYSHPGGKLFISDGKNVFLYTSGDNRVEKIPLKDTEDLRAPLAFLLGHLDMKKEFRDFRVREGEGGTWLDATAKTDRVPYSNLQMLVAADGAVRQLKIVQRDGSQISFAFSNERLGVPAPDALFRFTVPPGAEVVDSVALASQEK